MSAKPEKVEVQIKYKGLEQRFSAEPQQAWLLLNQFFKELLPTFSIAQHLMLKVDAQKLANDLQGIIAFSNHSVSLLVQKNKLTDNEALLVWLVACYLGHELGLLASDSLSKDELQTKLGKSGKITSTRLGELVKNDLATKTTNDRFKITAFGVVQTQNDVLPRVKSKINI